jgi:DNA-binding phage protein
MNRAARCCWLKGRTLYVTFSYVKRKGPAPSGFDRYLADRMKDSAFVDAYIEARAGIDSVDAFMRSLEALRARADVSKADLARRTGARPEAIRRLLTTKDANPTLETILSIAGALGYKLALVPARTGRTRKAA